MKNQSFKKIVQLPKECNPDQTIHPCGSTRFYLEDPEKCIFYKGGLRYADRIYHVCYNWLD